MASTHEIDRRIARTRDQVEKLRGLIDAALADDREQVLGDHTCIYATGSMGRCELGEHSDLDAFILRTDVESAYEPDAWLIQAAVIRASKKAGFPKPDADGRFLRMHTCHELLRNLGKVTDDASNTLTARMLLLLESAPLAGDDAHARAIEAMIGAYWINHDLHRDDYLPLVLVNDVIRYWRILLLNYEAKNKDRLVGDRRLRSYKLRFSRCLTCYSMIAALLYEARRGKGHVDRDRVVLLAQQTPLARLSAMHDHVDAPEQRLLDALRELYATFLVETSHDKDTLETKFSDDAYQRLRATEARRFGDAMFKLLQSLGEDNPLYRFVVV